MATSVVIGIMVFIFMVFAVLYGIATLNPSSFFTTGSADANATANLQANLTSGIDTFGSYIPTAFKILAVVFILGFIVLLIYFVKRMNAGGELGSL